MYRIQYNCTETAVLKFGRLEKLLLCSTLQDGPPPTQYIALLNNPEKKKEISSKIENELEMVEVPVREEDVEKTWNDLKTRITNIQEKDIGFTATNKKQEWITQEILDLMDDRRKQKANPIEYKRLNGIIRKKCREEKEIWMSTKCQEIEQLQAKYDTFNVHKKVKEFTHRHRKHQETILRNDNNEIILGVKAKLVRWKEYIETLFNDDRPCSPPPIDHILNEKAPAITKDEVVHAIKAQKSGKATGPDKINVEILKLIADNESRSLDLVTALFNKLYISSKIPSDWLKSTFVTLLKKPNASQCDDYRMISLMSHVLKTFLRIIHTRIYKKFENQMDNTQFGFRNGLGTREALFSLNVMTQRCRDMNVNVFACFIDYRKAFDCVNHQKMIKILRTTGVDEQDLRFISELYWHQTARDENYNGHYHKHSDLIASRIIKHNYPSFEKIRGSSQRVEKVHQQCSSSHP
ncbi:uncharacterized protein LOC115876118 [Sitophilus oryzae]|uniref:Uncharacterized protein LOC115876118 n=1 Tax=Sitophilus oryzae TaxID=7048 RepID=A0A6J2X9Z9_SITOR|nr:uncharacterized protein LOC115876118 [Sitophilus oryzae]